MQWMKRAWRGEEKLWKVFFYSLGIQILLAVIFGFSFGAFNVLALKNQISNFVAPTTITGPYLPSNTWWQIFTVEAFSLFVIIPLTIWQSIIVWKCSSNVKSKVWGYLARTITLIFFLWMPVDIVYQGSTVFSAILGNKSALYEETCKLDMELYVGGNWPLDGKIVTKEFIDEHPFDLKGCIQSYSDKETTAYKPTP